MNRLHAISDIHGQYDKLISVLTDARLINKDLQWFSSENWLIVCGDLIDRGPDSKKVLEFFSKMLKIGAPIILIKGNHEDMLLQGLAGRKAWLDCWLENGGIEFLSSYGLSDKQIISLIGQGYLNAIANLKNIIGEDSTKLMKSMISHLVLKSNDEIILFVHAGVNPKAGINTVDLSCDEFQSLHHLWIREQFYGNKDNSFVTDNYKVDRIVFGHTPTQYITGDTTNSMDPVEVLDGKALCIDTGSYYKNGSLTLVEILPNMDYEIVARA